jgi:metallo-beta-lactamase family protein
MSNIKLTFCGAAGEVTGSSYLVETPDVRFMVDCGMFQGGRDADAKNRAALNFDVKSLDFVLLTHAHIDHCGLLPRLTAYGFTGPIYASEATAALAKHMLEDGGRIQEKDAFDRNRRARQAKENLPELAPLYTVEQARDCAQTLTPIAWEKREQIHKSVAVTIRNTGHIIGSASFDVEITDGAASRRIVFSGDVGSPGRILVPDPVSPPAADVLLIESTYGNRQHKPIEETKDEFVAAIERMHHDGGNMLIPAFAVGRTQEVVLVLLDLISKGRIKNIPTVFIDSPLASKATDVTRKFLRDTDEEAQALFKGLASGKIALKVIYTSTPDESKAINKVRAGAIIIAGSGMCEAGRIRHHLVHNLPRLQCSVVFVGYQGEGTLGRRLIDGAKQVRLMRQEVQVRAKMHTIGGLSAHADQAGLLAYMRGIKTAPKTTYIVHGEKSISEAFGGVIEKEFGWKTHVPHIGETVSI